MSTDTTAALQHRLLLLSYHYPPSEAAGALRWQRLTPIAADHGWQVEVISLAPNLAGRVDWRRVAELPATTRIHGFSREEPIAVRLNWAAWRTWRALQTKRRHGAPVAGRPSSVHQEDMTWLDGGLRSVLRVRNILLQQIQEHAWAKTAIQTGLRVGHQFRPDLVLSCGPPHILHEAGRRLAAAFGVPFVMDMRDPWSLQVRLPEDVASPLWHKLARRAEARCIRDASLVVMNTTRAAAAMQRVWPSSRVMAVLNGWDEEVLPRLPWPRQFRIVYAGSIYIDRSPGPLFQAVAKMVRQLRLSPADLEIRLIGTVEAFGTESVRTMATEAEVGEYLRLLPVLSRGEILEQYAEAAILASLPQDSHFAIPSKVYEYLRQPCWILAQASRESATGEVLQDSGGFLVEAGDVEGMTRILVGCYEEFRAGRRPEPIARDGKFSRAAEGAKLMAALESLLPPS